VEEVGYRGLEYLRSKVRMALFNPAVNSIRLSVFDGLRGERTWFLSADWYFFAAFLMVPDFSEDIPLSH
jgi:hypothetical protein